MSTHENAQVFFLQRFAIYFSFSKFMTRNNHEFHYKYSFVQRNVINQFDFVKQTFKRRLRYLFRNRESLYQNDIIYFCHEENNCC